jgi:hypothetical protein
MAKQYELSPVGTSESSCILLPLKLAPPDGQLPIHSRLDSLRLKIRQNCHILQFSSL